MKQNKKRGAPKKEKTAAEKISFRLEPEMKEALTEMANEEGRSLSNYLKFHLMELVGMK